MASISSLGVGSGIDIQGLVDGLVEAERVPTETRLDIREAELQAELSSYGTFKSALSSFQSSFSGLTSLSSFQKHSVSIGSEDLFSASASSIAEPGNYSIEVKELAQSHTVATTAGTFSELTDPVGTGTITFTFGSYENADDTGAFTANADKTAQTVTIGDSDNTLAGVRDAVNAADIGVQASIIDDGSGYRLVFSSEDSGTENAMQISVNENPADGTNVDAAGLSRLVYTSTDKQAERTLEAKDAELVVNGLSITRSSNSVVGAVQGVTLNLKSASVGNPTNLTIANDTDSVQSSIQGFVDSFNSLQGILNSATSYDPETEEAGVLLGDSTVRNVSAQLRRIMGNSVTGLDGEYRALVDIGITTNRDGTLALDTSKLQTALENDFSEIGKLFAASGTPSDSGINYLSSTDSTAIGSYAVNITTAATQGVYTGAASSTLDLITNDNTFKLAVDGTLTGTISLTQQVYGSEAELAAEMQRQINADSNLIDKGISVTVTHDGSGYVITSGGYGSDSAVNVISTNTGLGLDGGTSTAGVDVEGSIGGTAAIGSGQLLTGLGDAAGLKLEVTGTTTGSRGNVVFSRGVVNQLNTLIDDILSDDGSISSRTEGIEASIEDINEQREALAKRMDALEARLTSQFINMDLLVAQLQNTGDYLNQQLESISKIGSSD